LEFPNWKFRAELADTHNQLMLTRLAISCLLVMLAAALRRPATFSCVKNFSQVHSMRAFGSVRPSIDDVENLSYGRAAKRRGTGSRKVPHRLNQEERIEFDVAKRKHFVALRGSGYRKERGASPLANIYRQYCDSIGIPCISIKRGISSQQKSVLFDGTILDEVNIDFSTLRDSDFELLKNKIMNEANSGNYEGLVSISDGEGPALDQAEEKVLDDLLDSEVIWRLPPISTVFTFSIRNEAKKFASAAASLADTTVHPSNKSDDE